jgi:phage tail sheath protein FI
VAPTYLAPGVYVEEQSSGSRPIEAVGTSVAGFVGVIPGAPASTAAVAVNNVSEFQRAFLTPPPTDSSPLIQAVFGFFGNGGSRLWIVNLGTRTSLVGDAKGRAGLDFFTVIDEIAIVAAPGFTGADDYDALLTHCETMKDRVAVLDAPAQVPTVEQLTRAATDAPDDPKAAAPAQAAGLAPRQSDRGFGAVYYPWVYTMNVITGKPRMATPPSGHIAGIYARVDGTRGVFKAPANESIAGVTSLVTDVARQDQEVLNPAGVNCIRSLTEGIRVWGARTVAPSASEWRYVPVRRLFCMIEKSIVRSTRWVVFEPNDISLWKGIRRDVTAFLTLLWRQGALMGATPAEAFFVKCDAETNPPEVVDAGQVVILIGIAPVKPAEFVIFRIGQGVGGAETATVGKTAANA